MSNMFQYETINGEDRVFLLGRDILDISKGSDSKYSKLCDLVADYDPDFNRNMSALDWILEILEEEDDTTSEEAMEDIVEEKQEEYARLSFEYKQIELEISAYHYLLEHLEIDNAFTALYRMYRASVHYGLHKSLYNEEEKFVEWLNDQWDIKYGGYWGEGRSVSGHTEYLNEEISYTLFVEAEYRGGGEQRYIIGDYVFIAGRTNDLPLDSISPYVYCEECKANWYGEGGHYWQYDGKREGRSLHKYPIVQVETFESDIKIDLASIGDRLERIKEVDNELELVAVNFDNGPAIIELERELLDLCDDLDSKFVFSSSERETEEYYSYWYGRWDTRTVNKECGARELANTLAILTSEEDSSKGLCPVCRKGYLQA